MTRQRDAYAEVGSVARSVIVRALPELTKPELKVLLAVVHYLVSYSRLSDTVSRRQIEGLTGLDSRAVRRALHSLHDRGVITYEAGSSPAGGRRQPARITLSEETDRGSLSPPVERSEETDRGSPQPPVTTTGGHHDRGSLSPATGGHSDPRPGVTMTPIREGTEKSSEEGRRASTLARQLVTAAHDELPALIEQLNSTHQPAQVLDQLEQLTAAGARYRWPSELRTAITTSLRHVRPTDETSHPAVLAATHAADCVDPTCVNGWIETDDDTVTHCPTCHPQALTA